MLTPGVDCPQERLQGLQAAGAVGGLTGRRGQLESLLPASGGLSREELGGKLIGQRLGLPACVCVRVCVSVPVIVCVHVSLPVHAVFTCPVVVPKVSIYSVGVCVRCCFHLLLIERFVSASLMIMFAVFTG